MEFAKGLQIFFFCTEQKMYLFMTCHCQKHQHINILQQMSSIEKTLHVAKDRNPPKY